MVVEGIVSNLVAKALEALGKAALQEAVSWWGARDDLKQLQKTIRMIEAVVEDAEKRQEAEGSKPIKEWLRRLKLVLYQADDLFDEIVTRDRQKQRMESRIRGKVGILFTNYKLASEIKSIKKELDAIKSDMPLFNFNYVRSNEFPMSDVIKNRETASLVNTECVITRDTDKANITNMIFDPKYAHLKVAVISIVGHRGVGKTTLAQLVFKDVKEHFDLSQWVYLPETNNLNGMYQKIFNSFKGEKNDESVLENILKGIEQFIGNKKYLLVLDDVWDEGGNRLFELISFLKKGQQGSKIIITTPSFSVPNVVGTINQTYKLEPLTNDEAWELFKMLAFKQGEVDNDPTFSKIGKEIVHMCGNVPLAIRVVGGLLRTMDTKEEWLQARNDQRSKSQLTKVNDIMDVLKLSYDHLPPTLKQCFAYCSLFPKGCDFDGDDLVYMWMAQGYFDPSNNYEGYQLFKELLMRCFFEDSKQSADGNVKSCKMHDLLHDLAEKVAGEESMLIDGCSSNQIQITHRLMHANLLNADASQVRQLFDAKRIRSLFLSRYKNNFEEGISRLKYLRLLKVKSFGMKLPNDIGRLMHLRYLCIQSYEIEYLPDSITRLENLQTLNVEDCFELRGLPCDFAKLVNIRHLLLPTSSRSKWTDLPCGFGKLESLRVLNGFIVGENNGLDSLPALSYRGELLIKFCKWRRNAISEAQSAKLKNSDQLTSLKLEFEEKDTPPIDEMSEMLMNLQLPPNITNLEISDYKGDKMPSMWLDGLTKLVSISIVGFLNCKVVPRLSQLPHLKEVTLCTSYELEYIEDEDNLCPEPHPSYFQSLQVLKLTFLPKLKGWKRASNNDIEAMMLVPPLPKLESLIFREAEWKVIESIVTTHVEESSSSSAVSTSLKRLEIGWVNLVSLSIGNSLRNLNELVVQFCGELKSLEFTRCNSIHKLEISDCKKLEKIEGLQHLRVLETLKLENLEEDKVGWEWDGLTSLRDLELGHSPKLEILSLGITSLTQLEKLSVKMLNNLIWIPSSIYKLSRLRDLNIFDCPQLQSLPASLHGLRSLQSLSIISCPSLEKRYKEPDGEDCGLILHIPHVFL